jgi:hypothetical protein
MMMAFPRWSEWKWRRSAEVREHRSSLPYQYALSTLEQGLGLAVWVGTPDFEVGRIVELLPNLRLRKYPAKLELACDSQETPEGWVWTHKRLVVKRSGDVNTQLVASLKGGMTRKQTIASVLAHGRGCHTEAQAFGNRTQHIGPVITAAGVGLKKMWDIGPNAKLVTAVDRYSDVTLTMVTKQSDQITAEFVSEEAATAILAGLPARIEASKVRQVTTNGGLTQGPWGKNQVTLCELHEWSGEIAGLDPEHPIRHEGTAEGGQSPALSYRFHPSVTWRSVANRPLHEVLVPVTAEKIQADLDAAVRFLDQQDRARDLRGATTIMAVGLTWLAARKATRHRSDGGV